MNNTLLKNMKYIDLHTHSSRSDGFLSRDEVIQRAIKNNKEGIILAISDHNELFEDLPELQAKYGSAICLVSGTEVSVNYNYMEQGIERKIEIHILGIGYDIKNKKLADLLSRNKFDKKAYIEELLRKLDSVGIHVADNFEEVVAYTAPSQYVGRMAIARMAKDKLGIDIEHMFDEYIGNWGRRRCYVYPDCNYMDMQTAVKAIHEAGGVCVLAHPLMYKLDEDEANLHNLHNLIQGYKDAGGDALETYHSKFMDKADILVGLAEEYGLGKTCGSDFHGNPGEHLHHKFLKEMCDLKGYGL